MNYEGLTALRLKLAMEAVGLNQTSLANAWREYNDTLNLSDAQGLPVTRKTVGEWLEKGIPRRSPKRGLKDPLLHVAKFFGVEKEIFIEEGDDWSEISFQIAIRKAWPHQEEQQSEKGVMAVLSEITEITEIKNLERIFRDYEGYYYCYEYWVQWESAKEIYKPKSVMYKTLIKINEIDYPRKLIKIKMATSRSVEAMAKNNGDFWECHGVMIPVSNSLYFIAESKYRTLEESYFVFVVTRRTSKTRLIGLLTSTTTMPQQEYFRASMSPFPASTRILFCKIADKDAAQGEEHLVKQLGIFQADELHELDPEILKELRNEVNEGVLTTW